jgi:hypothetical protein
MAVIVVIVYYRVLNEKRIPIASSSVRDTSLLPDVFTIPMCLLPSGRSY